MFILILRRIAIAIPTFIGITLLTFTLVHMIPGDPVAILSGEKQLDSETHAAIIQRLGLNDSLPTQYWRYLSKMLQGDLGQSFVNQEKVIDEFFTRFPATLELSFFAMLLATLIGLPLGIVAALKHKSVFDHGVMIGALTGYSIPIYWWGLLLILFFSVQLGWTPVAGRIAIEYDIPVKTGFLLIDTLISQQPGAFMSAVKHLILPSCVLATIPLAVITRMIRTTMLEVLREDYIKAARARGLSSFRVIWIHALRNAFIPVLTVMGLQIGSLLAGAVLTETTFSWPGIGKWLIEAILRRDYIVVQGAILLIATMVLIVNLFVDILYGFVNPRIRHAENI